MAGLFRDAHLLSPGGKAKTRARAAIRSLSALNAPRRDDRNARAAVFGSQALGS
jgi:hypothetical protein